MTQSNTHRRMMRPVTPVVRFGRNAAGAAIAATVLVGGGSAALADGQPQAGGEAAPATAVQPAPAVQIPPVDMSGTPGATTVAAQNNGVGSAAESITVKPKAVERTVADDAPADDSADDAAPKASKATKSTKSSKASTPSKASKTSAASASNTSDDAADSADESTEDSSSKSSGSSILATARSGIGTRYVFGGSSRSGWDCSGFTSWVYRQHGISLPHSASGQKAMGRVISRSEARPGDLVYKPGHIGIYAGGNQFVDAGNSRVDTSERNIYSGSWTYIRIG